MSYVDLIIGFALGVIATMAALIAAMRVMDKDQNLGQYDHDLNRDGPE